MSSALTLATLRVFLAAAERLNFSRAAEDLGVSQPYVSARISALEGQLGIALFDRVPARGVELTEAGGVLRDCAGRIMAQLALAEARLAELRGVAMGRLRLAASTTPGAHLVPGLLAVLSSTHPAVRVSLTVAGARVAEQAVLDGEVDLAVIGGPVTSGRLVRIVVGTNEMALAVPAGHPWARRESVRPDELSQVTLLQREPTSSTRWLVDQRLRQAGVTPARSVEFDDVAAIKQAVVAGLGVAVLSTRAVRAERASGLLRTVPIDGLDLTEDVNAVYRADTTPTSASAAFLALLNQVRTA